MQQPAVALLLATAALAQAPDTTLVISAMSAGTNGGLYTHNGTRLFGGAVFLQGLPADLTGANNGLRGASCVTAEEGTGLLNVGEYGPTGTSIDLHRVQVNAGTATATELASAFVGTVSDASGGIEDSEQLPNGDVLLAVTGLANAAPLNGARLARWSRATGAITPLAITAPGGRVQCVAADPTGSTVYFHVRDAVGIQGTLYRAPIGGGAATAITGTAFMTSLTTSPNGNLWGTGNTYQLELSPLDGSLLSSAILNIGTQCVAMDEVAWTPIVVAADGNNPSGSIFLNGTTQLMPGIPPTSTGVVKIDSHRAYGPRTDGLVAYDWIRTTSAPQPGSSFAIRVDDNAVAPQAGLLFAALAAGNANVIGIDVLLDLGSTTFLGLIPTRANTLLAIPAGVPLGTQLFLQAAFPDAGPLGLSATRGLRINIVP